MILDAIMFGKSRFPPNIYWSDTKPDEKVLNRIDTFLDSQHCLFRKYQRSAVRAALVSIVCNHTSVSAASVHFGIKRTTLHFYLKKLFVRSK